MTAPALRRAGIAEAPAVRELQEDAYAANRSITGHEPWPLTWDYAAVLRDREVWVMEDDAGLTGVLILDARADGLFIESIAVAPRAQGLGLGDRLLDRAHDRAADLHSPTLRLIANEKMTRNVDWYGRRGFVIEWREQRSDRTIIHMVKTV